MDIATLLVFGLAIWRVSSILVAEEGPYLIFWKLREWLGVDQGPTRFASVHTKFLPQLFSCIWCMSLWLAIVWYVAYRYNHTIMYTVSVPLAWSAIAILVEKQARH